MNSNRLRRIAVTMGDPAGIGPEICLQLLNDPVVSAQCTPIVFGDAGVLRRVATKLQIPFGVPVLSPTDWARNLLGPAIVDLAGFDSAEVIPGRVDARCGEAAFRYVIAAIEAGLTGQVDAVATAPLNKEALHAAGYKYPGHTEIFAERMQASRACMMLTSPELTCSFATVHVGYHEVPGLLSARRILDVIELTADAMQRIRGRAPRLAVCGLNPHAGEHGLFGQREEERLIICMYHDQGHIPLKALAFDSAINTTLGLPVIRTSVDHGTAFDIAWRGQASHNSLVEAVLLAARLSVPAV